MLFPPPTTSTFKYSFTPTFQPIQFYLIMTLLRSLLLRHGNRITVTTTLLLLARPGSAQTPHNATPGPANEPNISRSSAVVILVLITAFFFMGFISLYIRHCSDDEDPTSRQDPGGSVFRARRAARGLDPEVVEKFPVFNYAAVKELKIGKYELECAVCLTEFDDDDNLRLLPHCDHVFHPECIDEWLVAHTTCPVCRADLRSPPPESDPEVASAGAMPPAAEERENWCMEQPLQRNPTVRRNASFGGPRRLWGRIARSFSTGHVAVKQWENLERFRLRLPEEVRKEVMSGKLQRATSMVVLPRETSSMRGYRTGFGEGSSRGRSKSLRSDRWVFSFSFLSRALSFKPTASRQGSLRGSVQAESTRLPV